LGENKPNCRDDQSSSSGIMHRAQTSTAVLSETLRNGAAAAAAASGKGEERISLFWRIFGGTLLSIAALVVVTVYQQFSNSVVELRNDMIRLNESRADLLKKDEFNNRMTSVWNSIKDLQTANTAVTGMRERSALLEQQLKAAEDERKELTKQLQQLRERLAAVEGRVKVKPADSGD
jgi:hypothetical protein